jgi:hypothetical protein
MIPDRPVWKGAVRRGPCGAGLTGNPGRRQAEGRLAAISSDQLAGEDDDEEG